MPKFKVQVQEQCTYEVEVRALSKKHAEAVAIEAMVQAEDINKFFVSCDERDAVDVSTDNVWFKYQDLVSIEKGVKLPISCWPKQKETAA